MAISSRLCALLAHEFVLVAPCGLLAGKLLEVVDNLMISGLLSENKVLSKSLRRQHNQRHQDDDDNWFTQQEDDTSLDAPLYTAVYNVTPETQSVKYLKAFASMLSPLLDAYCITIESLQLLVGRQVLEKDIVMNTQKLVTEKLQTGSMKYGQS